MAEKGGTRRAARQKITARQRLELMHGIDSVRMLGVPGGWDERSQFSSREEKRRAWDAHKGEIMAVYRGKPYRPAGWWIFERGIDGYPDRWEQAEVLRELGEL